MDPTKTSVSQQDLVRRLTPWMMGALNAAYSLEAGHSPEQLALNAAYRPQTAPEPQLQNQQPLRGVTDRPPLPPPPIAEGRTLVQRMATSSITALNAAAGSQGQPLGAARDERTASPIAREDSPVGRQQQPLPPLTQTASEPIAPNGSAVEPSGDAESVTARPTAPSGAGKPGDRLSEIVEPKTRALKALAVRIDDRYTIRYTPSTKTLELLDRNDASGEAMLKAQRGLDGKWQDLGSRLTEESVNEVSARLEQFTARLPRSQFNVEKDLSPETQKTRAQETGNSLMKLVNWTAGTQLGTVSAAERQQLPPDLKSLVEAGEYEQVGARDPQSGISTEKLQVRTNRETIIYDPKTSVLQAYSNDSEGKPHRLYFEGKRNALQSWQPTEHSFTTAADAERLQQQSSLLPKPSFNLEAVARPTVQQRRAADIISALETGTLANIRRAQSAGTLEAWRKQNPSLQLDVRSNSDLLRVASKNYVIEAHRRDRSVTISAQPNADGKPRTVAHAVKQADGRWQASPGLGLATEVDVNQLPSRTRQQVAEETARPQQAQSTGEREVAAPILS